jgi:hypothetical protein
VTALPQKERGIKQIGLYPLWSIKVEKYKTKLFDEIEIDIDEASGNAEILAAYNDSLILFTLHGCDVYADTENLKLCIEIMDKYIEIIEISKKAIIENYTEDENIKNYFEYFFNDLTDKELVQIFKVKDIAELGIKEITKNMEFPNILFYIENDELVISVNYIISVRYSDDLLCVKMNKELKVNKFLHELEWPRVKVKSLFKQIGNVKPKPVDNFSIDIEFIFEEKFKFRDIYGKYTEEGLYVPFNDKNKKITVLNIEESFEELKKYCIDVIEKQKKYINYRGYYFELKLIASDVETGEVLAYFSGRNDYHSIECVLEHLLEKLNRNKNGVLFDMEYYSDNYDDDIIIERVDNFVYIFVGPVYPDMEILQKDVETFVKIDASNFYLKIDILRNKAEETMKRLKNDLGKDYYYDT